jgi:hypothetical protein
LMKMSLQMKTLKNSMSLMRRKWHQTSLLTPKV